MRDPKKFHGWVDKPDSTCEIGPLNKKERRDQAFLIRQEEALFQKKNGIYVTQHCNGDEELYQNKIGNFSKALPHNPLGVVSMTAYEDLLRALSSGDPEDFEYIPLGDTVKLSNPQAAYSYDFVGPDSHQFSLEAPPRFSSAWEAGEMAELYWRALTRDIPFTEYDMNAIILEAVSDLNNFSDFRGPKDHGKVTTKTLFRGNTPGDLTGPFVSQFLWKDVRQGIRTVNQQYLTPKAGSDFLTSYDEWLKIQNGQPPTLSIQFDSTARYIRNGRDLTEWVHQDYTFQAFLNAALILMSFGPAALDPANPYLQSKTQSSFVTFGQVHILDFVAKATRQALEAAWFQKWLVHRRLRPEEFGGFVHNHLTGKGSFPIHQELLHSKAVEQVEKQFGTYLLPMAYPEGCPTHPSYPAGHACVVGAGATILKAFFKESFEIPTPVVANSDGTLLLPYTGPSLTIGGELNKLAANIAHARDTAGVHWRSDGEAGIKLGEQVAIGILQSYRRTYNEPFNGFSLTKFDGTVITI